MKKTAIITTVLAGVLSLGGGTVYAAGQIARTSSIPEATARNFAYVDAGILPGEAEVNRTEFDFEDGRFVYEIEFVSGGVKYEYTVDASNGKIVQKESETLSAPAPAPSAPQTEQKTGEGNAATQEIRNTPVIGVERAKEIALSKAALSAGEVVFSKAKLERDDGRQVYDIEFYVAGEAEYEYEIDALSGDVLEESREERENGGYAGNPPSEGTTPVVSEAPETGKAGLPEDPRETAAPAETQKTGDLLPEPLSVDEAKAAALKKAGLSASDVVFSKAKLERDDGRLIYDVEFYVRGQSEYEYEIDAYEGTILEEEIEPWEDDD